MVVVPIFYLKQESRLVKVGFSFAVRAGRVELPHLAALDPKSSVSTSSTTPAWITLSVMIAGANIHKHLY